jgi:hypothetical protein
MALRIVSALLRPSHFLNGQPFFRVKARVAKAKFYNELALSEKDGFGGAAIGNSWFSYWVE